MSSGRKGVRTKSSFQKQKAWTLKVTFCLCRNAQPRSDVKSFGSFCEALGRYGNQQASVLALAGRASIGAQRKHTEKVLISRTLLEDRPCKHKSFRSLGDFQG